MKLRRAFLLLAMLRFSHADAQTVIPQPLTAEIRADAGFAADNSTRYVINAEPQERARLAKYIENTMSGVVADAAGCDEKCITLSTAAALDGITSPEGYTLEVSPQRVDIRALSAAGLFYGLQTLRQLSSGGVVPSVMIVDEPRFGYRGVMLDVSRHFFGKEHVKRQIDILSRYKFNRLHLHLTDAAGWRIEIKRYPRLTEYAAWRPQALWKEWWSGGREYAEEGSEGACGGYFTQDDIREIVAYASDRYMTVIPEIEMPSHSEEVLAAYPELSCSEGRQTQGEFCIGNEQSFEFIENVLTEVADLFPSHIIHIGGDEASKEHWRNCPKCRARAEAEGLGSTDELQGYMMRRIHAFAASKGLGVIGWDEILNDGLASDAVIMCWRGEDCGLEAAEKRHGVIMSPGKYCYFDAYQDAPYSQPEAIGGYLPLAKVYSYDPVPKGASESVAANIAGVQANLWAEYIPTCEHAEYMLYPRALALAEVAWSAPEVKNYDDFRARAAEAVVSLREEGVSAFDIAEEIGNRAEATTPVSHLALGKTIYYNEKGEFYPGYAAGGYTALADGLRGGWSYGDDRWQGFTGNEGVNVVIDLGELVDISSVGADFMQICGPEVFMPASVDIAVSDDGQRFTQLAHIDHEIVRDDAVSFKNFGWSGTARGRFVRYKAEIGKFGGFLFTDEIVVR